MFDIISMDWIKNNASNHFPYLLKKIEVRENKNVPLLVNYASLMLVCIKMNMWYFLTHSLVKSSTDNQLLYLQIKVDEDGKIIDAKFKTFGCGSAIASSSLATEWVKGKKVMICCYWWSLSPVMYMVFLNSYVNTNLFLKYF